MIYLLTSVLLFSASIFVSHIVIVSRVMRGFDFSKKWMIWMATKIWILQSVHLKWTLLEVRYYTFFHLGIVRWFKCLGMWCLWDFLQLILFFNGFDLILIYYCAVSSPNISEVRLVGIFFSFLLKYAVSTYILGQ